MKKKNTCLRITKKRKRITTNSCSNKNFYNKEEPEKTPPETPRKQILPEIQLEIDKILEKNALLKTQVDITRKKIVSLIGGPESGKNTQLQLIVQHFNAGCMKAGKIFSNASNARHSVWPLSFAGH
jgi:ABC-type polysaccharide/polyol phosphate transport system ATPase subunit